MTGPNGAPGYETESWRPPDMAQLYARANSGEFVNALEEITTVVPAPEAWGVSGSAMWAAGPAYDYAKRLDYDTYQVSANAADVPEDPTEMLRQSCAASVFFRQFYREPFMDNQGVPLSAEIAAWRVKQALDPDSLARTRVTLKVGRSYRQAILTPSTHKLVKNAAEYVQQQPDAHDVIIEAFQDGLLVLGQNDRTEDDAKAIALALRSQAQNVSVPVVGEDFGVVGATELARIGYSQAEMLAMASNLLINQELAPALTILKWKLDNDPDHDVNNLAEEAMGITVNLTRTVPTEQANSLHVALRKITGNGAIKNPASFVKLSQSSLIPDKIRNQEQQPDPSKSNLRNLSIAISLITRTAIDGLPADSDNPAKAYELAADCANLAANIAAAYEPLPK